MTAVYLELSKIPVETAKAINRALKHREKGKGEINILERGKI